MTKGRGDKGEEFQRGGPRNDKGGGDEWKETTSERGDEGKG